MYNIFKDKRETEIKYLDLEASTWNICIDYVNKLYPEPNTYLLDYQYMHLGDPDYIYLEIVTDKYDVREEGDHERYARQLKVPIEEILQFAADIDKQINEENER